MNEQYQEIYNYFKANKLTDLDANSFYKSYSDPSKSKELWSYLKQKNMTDLDANAFHSSYFGVKKKGDSQSTLVKSNTSSGRLSNTTTKPTASSSSPEILTNYLGKSKKKYKFENNQWYEENPKPQVAKSTPSKFGGTAKTYGQELKFNPNAAQGSWKPIEEESRIKALNYYYKKDGSLATEEKVFTNYDPEKKDNLYRIKNGQWERKVPKGYFAPVNDEIATKALNKRYGQNVVFTPTVAPVVKKKEDPKFMDINSNLTAKTEEDAIGYLEKNYGKYGFEFNQEGLFLVDQIRVKTKDGKKEEVFEFDEKNPEEAARLKAFLEENKSKDYSSTYNYLDEKVRNQSNDIPKGEGRSQQEIQDYLKAVQIKKGEYILSDDYLNNFKKLDADEMKDQITNVIGKSGLNSKTVQEFYKTDAYKAYKIKKAEANKSEQERINTYYDELKYAKIAGDNAKVKEAQNKIDAYLTNDVIADNVKNYDMQLNDLKNRNKQLETEYADYEKQVNKFNSDKTIIDQKLKSGEISREQYNGMIDGLNQRSDELNNLSENIQTKAQKIKLETDNVSTSQKKLNYVAGKYVAAKEKEGGAIGFAVNSVLNGVSGAFIEPFANYAALGNQYEDLSPEEKQYYKDKKYTKEQVENILDNKAILKAKNDAKEMLISSVGFEETTKEYMKSGDRGFIATALGGVLQSLPAMATGVFGSAASFTGLAAQAYSGIEEEMLNDPDFQTTSVAERSIISIPYAIGMGVLENYGLTNMIKGNSVTGRALQGLVVKTIEKAPKGATQDILNKLVAKEIESNIAKGVIKITQAGLAEFETGATQALVLDQGLKQAYNIYAQRKMTADEKKNLSQGEFFDTADSFGELASQTFEDGLAEMIGGVTLGAVGTLSQRILKGNVSIYNADDVEFLKNVAGDDNFKKLFVANLKTSMLNGSMTKGQAQEKLDALNEIQAVFTKLPDNISKDQVKQSMDLVVEKTKLEKEIAGKDPALVAAQTERINAINEELKTISQNAVQEQTTSEVPIQPGAKVGGEVAKGESQAGSQVIAEEGIQEDQVATYRAEEQAELLKAIPEIENYKVNGEIDKSLMPAEVLAKYDEIYNKYDELIRPLLETTEQTTKNLVTADNINDVIQRQTTPIGQKLAKSAKLVMKALPGSNIYLHETKEDFDQAVGETTDGTERGAFIPSDGSIHINMQAALPHTLLHEAFHAVVLSKKLDNDTLNAWTKGLKGIVKDKALLDRLNKLTSLYSAEEQSEEFISELGSIMGEAQKTLSTSGFQKFKVLINKIAAKAGLPPIFTAASTAQDAVDFINTVSGKLTRGEEIYVNDPGDGGEVGTFNIPKTKFQKAKSVADDPRDFIRELVEDADLREFNGQKFITNMYDYTNAGETDLGNGFKINLLGGKNYVPLMMSLNGKKLGEVSNLAAFNTKAQAETFIRNADKSGAELFAPHSGTLSQSWQFQQHTFAELFNLVLDKGILTPNELIDVFNNTIKNSAANQANFEVFAKKYGKNIDSFDSFESDPKKIIDLLDIKNNYSPKLRKALNNAIASNKNFQKAIGVNNKDEFYKKIMDPLNQGMVGGEIMNVVKFDPNTFEVVQTKESDADHHPSFGWTLLAKINGIYQPTDLYKSSDVTESYTKYNKKGEEVSRKADEPKFEQKNVSSSAGAIPKVAELDIKKKRKKQLVYHGGDVVNESDLKINEPLYVSQDKKQAELYAKDNKGKVVEFDIDETKLADEEVAFDIIDELGLKSAEGWDPSELNLFELIDPRFETSMSESDTKKLFNELTNRGYDGIKFMDTNLETLKQDIENYVIIDPKKTIFSKPKIKFQKASNKDSYIKIYGKDFTDVFVSNGIPFEYLSDTKNRKNPEFLGGKNRNISELRSNLIKSINNALASLEDDLEKQSRKIRNSDSDLGFRSSLINKKQERVSLLKDLKSSIEENLLSESDIEIGVKQPAIKFQKNEAIQKAKEKYDLSVKERGNTKEQGINSALEDLRKSDWYNKADDIQREEAERELKKFFGQKIKSAPSINKITGAKPTKIQVDEAAALKSQLRLEARAARDAKTDLNTKRKQIAAFIRSLETKGTITARQAAALVKRASSLNLDNPVMIVRFENYAEKIFQRAEYQDLLTSAFKVRRLIRKAIKSENQAEVVGMAKLFSNIDPSLVDDIDNYIEIAGNVLNAVRPSKEKGMDVALRQAANIEIVSEYANEEIAKQEENRKRELMSEYKYLVDSGVLTNDLSVKEMQEIINLIDNPTAEFDPEADQKKLNFLQNRLASMEAVFRYMLANNINPFTGEDVIIDPKDADLIKRLLKMDLNEMSVRDAAKVVEAMDNYLMNNITSGLEAAVRSYEGAQNAKQLVAQGKKARPLKSYFNKTIGRFFGEQMISLPLLFEKMFPGIKNAANVMQKMGLVDVINGSNKAIRQQNDLMTEWSKQDFYKEEGFMEAKNVYERGMLAFLKRNLIGTKTEIRDEFKRRVEIIKQSIDVLRENGTDKEKEMADLYEETYDKLGVAELDLDVIEARASKMNKDAVAWMINEWGKYYAELADVSLSVYNSMLGSDTNYTPDRYKKLSSEDKGLDEELLNSGSGFMMSMDYTDKNKTGVLMGATRPKVLPTNKKNGKTERYISLDFDVNNFNSLKGAFVDINTAAAIRQIDGFINSKAFNKLVPEAKDRDVLTGRINTYIQRAKGKRTASTDTIKDVERLANFITGLGVGKALAGLDQPIKQTIPVMINTFINSNGNMTFVNPDMNEAINRSGMPIANRGLESQTAVESIDRLLDKKGGFGAEAIKKLEDLNQFWLKTLLAKPDVWVARSSFITYYLKDMRSKGINVKDINWKTHEWNKDSAQYAQIMVDRQQNISDDKLAGDFLSSDDPTKRIVRKVIMPFATFIMNQKARMHNDFLAVRSKDSSLEDRLSAAKSIGGLAAELVSYQLIAFGIKTLVYDSIANALVGDDEEEKKDKSLFGLKMTTKQFNATKFPVKSIVGDILSPLPLLDDIVVMGFDKAMEFLPQISNEDIKKAVEEKNAILRFQGEDEMDSKTKTKFIEQLKADNIYSVAFKNDSQSGRSYGMIGIAGDTYKELIDLSAMAYTGEFEDEYQGRVTNKYLPEEDRKILQNISVPLMILYSTGIAPKDLGTVARKVTNIVKKKGVTENQHEKEKEVKKQIKRDLSSWEFELVKTRKKADGVVDEINYVESKGGLDDKQGKEYVKLIDAISSPSDDMLRDIQKGMTADQIIKKNTE